MNGKGISRRKFIGGVATSAFAATILPRHVLGGPGFMAPSDKLNIAGVGVGGMGKSNVAAVAGTENIVALCDVDHKYAARTFELYPDAKTYKDYREMFDQQKDIEAVIVATPDHTHAVIAMAAMDMGKHVYVQKPLTYSIHEARALANKAKETGVATQMGNQGHSSDDARKINEWIWDGVIGDVSEVHVWTNRPIWPQGMPRPTETPAPPDTLSWDLFLGPAPYRPYHPSYHPFTWRGWTDWGTGALGDMGAHLIDHPYWALKLEAPTAVETVSTPFNKESYPLATMTWYDFPARGDMPPVKMTWYDGGLMPARPEELDASKKMDPGGGVLIIGSKGKLMHETYGANPMLLPNSLMESNPTPKQVLPRVEGGTRGHEMNWVRACKGEEKTVSPLEYGGPLTETMLLGLVALWAGQKIEWDSQNMRVTNVPEANQWVSPAYREGWSL